MDDDHDYYEWSWTPKNASEENKTGVSFKGKDTEYINAHGKIVELFKKKGEKFVINGTELSIADKQKNKPINIEIKSKKGFSGKANLKIYDVNNRGGATMLITTPSGGDLSYAKILALDVIKYLLDNIISGSIMDGHMAAFKVKSESKDVNNKCSICDKVFTTQQRLKIHMSRFHATIGEKCDVCDQECESQGDLDDHMKRKHSIERSPEAKKLRISEDKNDDTDKESYAMDIDEEIVTLTKRRDIKVLEKQKSIELEVESMKQMRQRKEMLKEEEEKKRKRQVSVEKKKQKKKNKREALSRGGSTGSKVTNDADVGPGYMGYAINDNEESKTLTYEEVCQAYENLKQEYKELKEKYDKLNDFEDGNDLKDIRKLTKELRSLKDEYKECVEALKQETHDKVKAETTANVLKNIIESQEEIIEKKKLEAGNENEEMEIDDSLGVWIQQQKRKSIKYRKQNIESYKCKSCGQNFQNKQQLKSHEDNHKTNNVYCSFCDEIFVEKEDYENHQKIHSQSKTYKCNMCDITCNTNNDLLLHIKIHNTSQVEDNHEKQKFNCSKCDKEYTDMSKLRRHDWRSHRSIPCNICGEELQSRQDISEHRQKKHEIFATAVCKFYPNCFDQEECLFVHKEGNQNKVQRSLDLCPKGEDCNDQACSYSEWKHKTSKVLCKFQQNCNRINCPFKHTMPRKAFLGVNTSNFKEK